MADEPKRGSKTDYIKTLDALAKQANRLEDEAVRRAIRLLQDALREINQRVLTAEGWRLSNLENLQRQVNDIMERFRRQYTDAFSEIQTSAYRLGAQSVDEPLKVSGLRLEPARLNPLVVATLQGFSADLITKISEDVRTTINGTLTQSMLGLMSPFEAQKRISEIVGAKDKLSELTGISARAESIFRTEVGRVYSISTQARLMQVAETAPDVEKGWIATGDHRTRSGHLDAHGQRAKVDEPFEVSAERGGPKEKLMYPRDPRGSEENTINCRCRHIVWREGYGDFVPRTTTRVEQEIERRG